MPKTKGSLKPARHLRGKCIFFDFRLFLIEVHVKQNLNLQKLRSLSVLIRSYRQKYKLEPAESRRKPFNG
jgi:hypothetical protein